MNLTNENAGYDYKDIGNEMIKKRKIDLKRVIIVSIVTVFLSFVFSFCMLNKTMASLEGKWVRQPDDNMMANGMVIEIKNDGGMYIGQVVAINDESGMPIGTVKWNGFQKDALNVFAYYDKSFSTIDSDGTYSVAYGLVSPSGDKITLYCPGVSVGTHQVWLKEE